ncbi:MAG TPA: ABC transporter ATP-binding protein [Mycobacteriales bacterium]|jgi:branched-chain amino acid transport system ATP-binding protein|nr:ABC transporter ATP-binding protein [Mycobacteriales bacterium]
MTGARLEGIGVTKHFGGLTAVEDVTVAATPGHVAALIGPNGAGKTTLFQCLTGGERPDAGRVLLDGRDITRLTADARARLGIGRTFQRLAVFPSMTVLDNLRVGAENRSNAPAVLRIGGMLLGILGIVREDSAPTRRADEVIDVLGLGEVRDEVTGSLPTGTLRLVELGRALCHGPRVLLLDEPASGLDTTETEHLQRVLRQVAADGVAVLLVEHDVDLVFDVADHVYAMAEGQLIASGAPADVRRHPAVLEAYLDVVTEEGA